MYNLQAIRESPPDAHGCSDSPIQNQNPKAVSNSAFPRNCFNALRVGSCRTPRQYTHSRMVFAGLLRVSCCSRVTLASKSWLHSKVSQSDFGTDALLPILSVEAMEHIATPPPLRHNAVYSLPMRTSPGTYSKQGVAHAFGKICRLQGACKRTALRGCWVQIQPSRALNCPGSSGSRTHYSPLLRASVPIPCSPVESPCVPMGTHFLAWFWREN